MSDQRINFGPLIKALAVLADEVGKLVHITKENGSGHLASGDFFTPTYGPSRDEEDEIISVVKAFDPGTELEEAKVPIIDETNVDEKAGG